MKVAHKKGQDDLSKRYPIESETIGTKENEVQENNYWKDRELDELRKKYIQFNVLMEFVQEILELPQGSTFDQLGRRSFELVMTNLDADDKR